MADDLNFNNLSDAQKVMLLQKQLVDERREKQELRSRNATLALAAPPSRYKSVSDAQIATLQESLAKARADFESAQLNCRKNRADNASLSALSKAKRVVQDLELDLAKYKPTNLHIPEATQRSRRDQAMIEQLERKTAEAKQRLSIMPNSNGALLEFNKANLELKEFKQNLEINHARKLAAQEATRMQGLVEPAAE